MDTPHVDRATELRRVLPAIRAILLRDWDPIGVQNEPAAVNEYDQEALALYGMLASGATDTDMEAYLVAANDEIGLGGGSNRPLHEIIASLRQLGIRPHDEPPAV